MPVTVPSFDTNTIITTEINTFINQAKEYYTTNNSSFTGTDGATFKEAIPRMIAGLQAKVNANPATTMAEIDANYVNTEKEIELAKSDLEAAKTRVETLRKPDEQSYYESWFPINRPLKRSSVFIVLIIGIFFFMLSFMIVIRALGININVSFAPPPEVLMQLLKLFPWQSLVLIGILIVIATLALLRKI